jgi:putative transposase
MKKSNFSESQILAVLKEGEAGIPVAQIMRKHGISQATYYNWKSTGEVLDLLEIWSGMHPSV